ncbi:MAG: 50S ribosomal protein L11 methyltransferase [Proteobacteria bacterium]|nr:50S ribosomal protein L11 methyltransferase [Pseudomonadota bacterium]
MTQESWIRLTMTYAVPADPDDDPGHYFFDQDVYAALYAFGAAAIHEQDSTTLDGAELEPGTKRLLSYFDESAGAVAADARAQILQIARNASVAIDITLESFDDQTWKDAWKRWFKPAQVSPRIAIRAPWSEFDPAPGTHVIVIEPGMAFGTGLHETTQLCIRAIDTLTQQKTVASLLDVGCGSGVLAIAGACLGIPEVHGVDNDPVCIDVSRENADTNHSHATFDETDIWDIETRYDLVVANIISSVLRALKEDLKAACKPGGTLVLSGVLAAEREDVEAAFLEGITLEKIGHEILGEWCSITFLRP